MTPEEMAEEMAKFETDPSYIKIKLEMDARIARRMKPIYDMLAEAGFG